MNLTIIQLGIMHLDDCVHLDQESLEQLWTKSQWKKELIDPKRICLGIMDLQIKKLLGICSAWLIMDELHITFLAVHPTYQRKGLGKSLLSELFKRSKTLETNYILLEVKDNNSPAKAFYKTMGFKIVGKRSTLYKDGSDALILKKETKN